jgi:hypothetical protein
MNSRVTRPRPTITIAVKSCFRFVAAGYQSAAEDIGKTGWHWTIHEVVAMNLTCKNKGLLPAWQRAFFFHPSLDDVEPPQTREIFPQSNPSTRRTPPRASTIFLRIPKKTRILLFPLEIRCGCV